MTRRERGWDRDVRAADQRRAGISDSQAAWAKGVGGTVGASARAAVARRPCMECAFISQFDDPGPMSGVSWGNMRGDIAQAVYWQRLTKTWSVSPGGAADICRPVRAVPRTIPSSPTAEPVMRPRRPTKEFAAPCRLGAEFRPLEPPRRFRAVISCFSNMP